MEIPFTLRQLQYFQAAASSGSLSSAADLMGVTPTALSLALEEFEKRLGLSLLIRRKGRGIILTSDGHRILEKSKHLLSDAVQLMDEASDSRREVSGVLRVGVFTTLAPFFSPPILKDFAAKYPGIDVRVVEGSAQMLHDQLISGQLDLAVQYGFQVSENLFFTPLFEFRPYLLVPAEHRVAALREVSLKQVADDPVIGLNIQPTLQNTRHIYEQVGISPTIIHNTSSFEVARCLVGNDLGVTVLFQRAATTSTYDGTSVVALRLTDSIRPSTLGVVQAMSATETERVRVMVDFVDDFLNTSEIFQPL
ncbi:MAG: LysR family transcriptional regulator [Micrococcaceae bacterium]|nr:LysR family transcriptional regulator [Micrococcaceae bacterium]